MYIVNFIINRLKSEQNVDFSFSFWSAYFNYANYKKQAKTDKVTVIRIDEYKPFIESLIEAKISHDYQRPLDFVAGCFSRYDWTRDQVEALEINDTQQTINVKIGYCADGGPTNKEWNLMYLIAMSTILYFYLLDDEIIRPELDLGKQSTHPIVNKFMSCINVDIPAYLISQPGDYKFVG